LVFVGLGPFLNLISLFPGFINCRRPWKTSPTARKNGLPSGNAQRGRMPRPRTVQASDVYTNAYLFVGWVPSLPRVFTWWV